MEKCDNDGDGSAGLCDNPCLKDYSLHMEFLHYSTKSKLCYKTKALADEGKNTDCSTFCGIDLKGLEWCDLNGDGGMNRVCTNT